MRISDWSSDVCSSDLGKTTVFNCVGGFYKPTTGTILMDDKPINGLPSHKVARLGLVRTFQNVRLFKKLTVLENLLVAQHMNIQTGLLQGLLKVPSYRRAEREARSEEHTSELQSLMRISYAVFCLKKKK